MLPSGARIRDRHHPPPLTPQSTMVRSDRGRVFKHITLALELQDVRRRLWEDSPSQECHITHNEAERQRGYIVR